METLLKLVDRLMGPDGCPWDQNQTLANLREDLLEEACEVIDAIDQYDEEAITEELGDLLFVVLFLIRVAEKEEKGRLSSILQGIQNKIIRRHPHVFSEVKPLTKDEVEKQWQTLKEKEKGKQDPLARISKSLPALSRGIEIIKAFEKHKWPLPQDSGKSDEEELGWKLLSLVQEGYRKGINPEQALRKVLSQVSQEGRSIRESHSS